MIHIRLLGTPTFERDGKPLASFKSRKVLALFAYLALNPGAHTRSQLAGLLWSDSSEKKALDNLRFALWNLNAVIGETIFDADRVAVAWRANAAVTLDTDEFLRALRASADDHHAPSPEKIAALARVAELYRGDLLAEFELAGNVLFNEWLQEQRACLREYALDALYRLAQFHTAHHHLPDAITTTRRLLALDPWREEAHRALMLLFARSGQRTAALAQFALCQRILREELGVAPSAQTTKLFERIRAAEQSPRHNLPAPLTPFVGRADELAEILRLLDDPDCRLLTLVGPGGVGKTRLALAAAAQRVERFLNGVAWIALDTVDASAPLVPALAEHFGVELRAGNPLEQLGNLLRGKELLLVLDNLERLRASAGHLTELLRRAPDLKILATSRERLNLQSEWLVPVEGLAFPREARGDIAAFGATQLFVQTARRVRARFTLDESNALAIARICQLVEGLPLGVELAAASVHDAECADIARALERNRDALATTMPDVAPRHRSLRAVFEYSWHLLSDEERAAFRRLAVFRGGFREAAAELVADTTLALLFTLVGKSLLRHTRTQRYEMLETVRQFVEEQLRATPEEIAPTRRAHAQYFADFLFERQAALRAGKVDALAQVAEDLDNIRAAWRWASERAELDMLARAAEGLGCFFETRSWLQEGADTFARAHDVAARAANVAGARVLAWEGLFALRLADYAHAQTLLETSHAIFGAAREWRDDAFALNNLGLVAERLGKREQARAQLEASVACAQMTHDEWASARALNNLGYVHHLAGDETRAQELLEQALTIRQRLDDRPGAAKTLINLASVLGALGKYREVHATYQAGLAIFQELGNRLGIAVCLNNLGFNAFQQQQFVEAKNLYAQALTLRREISDAWGVAVALDNLGAATCALGEYAAARAYYAEALTVAREIHATRRLVEVLVGVATLAAREEKSARAVELLTVALNHPAIGVDAREPGAHLLAELATQLPRPEFEAAAAHGRSLELEELVGEIIARGE